MQLDINRKINRSYRYVRPVHGYLHSGRTYYKSAGDSFFSRNVTPRPPLVTLYITERSLQRRNAADPLQLRHGDDHDGCAEVFPGRSRLRDLGAAST